MSNPLEHASYAAAGVWHRRVPTSRRLVPTRRRQGARETWHVALDAVALAGIVVAGSPFCGCAHRRARRRRCCSWPPWRYLFIAGATPSSTSDSPTPSTLRGLRRNPLLPFALFSSTPSGVSQETSATHPGRTTLAEHLNQVPRSIQQINQPKSSGKWTAVAPHPVVSILVSAELQRRAWLSCSTRPAP